VVCEQNLGTKTSRKYMFFFYLNEGIVKLITLMVKGNETITKMKVLQLHIKSLLKWPYTINVANIAVPSCIYTNDFALVH